MRTYLLAVDLARIKEILPAQRTLTTSARGDVQAADTGRGVTAQRGLTTAPRWLEATLDSDPPPTPAGTLGAS